MVRKYRKQYLEGLTIGAVMNHIQKRMTEQTTPDKKKYNRKKLKQNWRLDV